MVLVGEGYRQTAGEWAGKTVVPLLFRVMVLVGEGYRQTAGEWAGKSVVTLLFRVMVLVGEGYRQTAGERAGKTSPTPISGNYTSNHETQRHIVTSLSAVPWHVITN